MSQARRAAADVPEALVPSEAPRRGRNSGVMAALSKAVAPTAMVLLLAVTTTLTFVPVGAPQEDSAADPIVVALEVRTAHRNSREFVRTPTPAPSPTVTRVVSTVAPILPSASVAAPVEVTPSATPSPSPSPSPSVQADPPPPAAAAAAVASETPSVDWSIQGNEAGTRWTTTSVNVRSGPGTTHDVITAFAEARKVTITDSQHDGWQQVSLRDGAGWVKASYLTDEKPATPTTKATATAAVSSSSASSSNSVSGHAGACPRAGSAENGMKSRTVGVLRKVCAAFPGISSYGGYRAGSSGYHGSGQAIDAMISGESGWEVARWVRANASSLGVVEVIYAQKIWTKQRSGDGWRSMSGRGSATANHFDHVHISVG